MLIRPEQMVDPIRVHHLPMRMEVGSSLVRVCLDLTQVKITPDRALNLLTPMHGRAQLFIKNGGTSLGGGSKKSFRN